MKDTKSSLGVKFRFKSTTRLYSHQTHVISKVTQCNAHGIVVMPCGSGKTGAGIGIGMAGDYDYIVCVCNSRDVGAQWRSSFLAMTHVEAHQIMDVYGSSSIPVSAKSVIITTYAMLNLITFVKGKVLVLLDEVHVVPAETYTTNFNKFVNALAERKCTPRVIGLTATLLREDGRIIDLPSIVGGGTICEVPTMELEALGILAKMHCHEVVCDIPDGMMTQYNALDSVHQKVHQKNIFSALNPVKLAYMRDIISHHTAQNEVVALFVDQLPIARLYCAVFEGIAHYTGFLMGDVPADQRAEIVRIARTDGKRGMLIIMTKVGDTGIDIPNLKVVIEASSCDGSERQMTQRFGRGLRKKARDVSNEACFYSVYNNVATEKDNFKKRSAHLVKEGYVFARSSVPATAATEPSVAMYSERPDHLAPFQTINVENVMQIYEAITRNDVEEARNDAKEGEDVTMC